MKIPISWKFSIPDGQYSQYHLPLLIPKLEVTVTFDDVVDAVKLPSANEN